MRTVSNLAKIGTALVCIFYTWFCLPIMRGYFYSQRNMLLFFSMFIVGMVFLFIDVMGKKSGKISVGKNFSTAVYAYLIVFTIICLLGVDTANAHIRVSFTFWGTAIFYDLIDDYPKLKKFVCKYFIVLMLIVLVTTCYGVWTNYTAARTLAYGSNAIEEDRLIMQQNVSSIYFIQCFVICIPLLLMLRKKWKNIPMVLIFVVGIIMEIRASFTISILMMFVAVFLYLIYEKSADSHDYVSLVKKLVFLIMTIIFLLNLSSILDLIAGLFENAGVEQRMREFSSFLSLRTLDSASDLSGRIKLYNASLQTFFQHPLGVGAHYTYIRYENGIGYHSAILDDLARFGIFALAFYVCFIKDYYKTLKFQYQRMNAAWVSKPIVILYVLFLILNLAFRSGEESVIMLFIIPSIPELFVNENT